MTTTDLNDINPKPPQSGPRDPGTPAGLGPRVATPDEKKRGEIASLLTWTLVGLVTIVGIASLMAAGQGCTDEPSCKALTTHVESFKTAVEIVLTPMVGLVGAVVGFYFGGKAAELK